MKRTTERKTLAALLIGLMLATGIGTAVIPAAFMTDEALAETPIIVADEIAETYAVGEAVALPEQVPITYGGESFTGEDGVLVYPDATVRAADEISFASPYAYLSIELIGIKGAAAVEIIRINNQAISGTTHNDNATPTAYFPNEGGYKAPGSVVTIFAPDVGDVLSPVLKRDIVITVVNAGKYATSTDGVVLDGTQDPTRDYQLDVGTELGAYIVTLTASDALCVREYAEEYTITVVDVEPPTITL